MDSAQKTAIHHTKYGYIAVCNCKLEQLGPPLVQEEKYEGEKANEKTTKYDDDHDNDNNNK